MAERFQRQYRSEAEMEMERDGHRGRLRSRYLKAGGDGFTDL